MSKITHTTENSNSLYFPHIHFPHIHFPNIFDNGENTENSKTNPKHPNHDFTGKAMKCMGDVCKFVLETGVETLIDVAIHH